MVLEQGTFWEAWSRSAGLETLCEVVTLGTIPRQLNVVQTSHYYMLITFIIQLHFYLGRGLPDGLFPSMFPTKYIYF